MSVAYRFLLASLLIFAWCLLRKLPLRFSAREHGWLALFGLGAFGVSYVFVYYAEQHVASGLVAVGYSASPLLGMLGMRAFFGTPMTRRVALASILGIGGIVAIFYPELAQLRGGTESAKGALFNQRAGLPLWQGMAWGMFYGGVSALLIGLGGGKALSFEPTAKYALSLAYLAILGSIVAFASYLTLLKHIGVARAGYIGVMVPVVALFVSAAFEGLRFHALTWVGILISIAGNVLILGSARPPAPRGTPRSS